VIGPRAPETLASENYDLLVIGGGLLGAFLAWDASLRGLKTALVERDDFGAATTSASGRVLHGGLRSLQHMDPRAAALSLRERDAISRLAPDLCAPLPFLFPTEAGQRESLLFRGAALIWNAFVRSTPGCVSPPARFAASVPNLTGDWRNLAPDGGLLVHDRQIVAPERLVLAVLAAAVAAGAVVCNRVEAEQILVSGGRVSGARVRDHVADRRLEIRATRVINAAGPWATELWPEQSGPRPRIGFARGVHLVIDRVPPPMALGLPWTEQSADGRWSRARRVFVMPWAGVTLVGASWQPVRSPPERHADASREEIERFRTDIQERWPELGLTTERTRYVTSGLYPLFGFEVVPRDRYALARRPFVQHHEDRGGPAGLVTVIAVKLTTARALAERILDEMAERAALSLRPCATADATALRGATSALVAGIGFEPIRKPEMARRLARLSAEREQAGSLEDLFLRRTVAGQFGVPAREVLDSACAELAGVLGWKEERREVETRQFLRRYRRMGVIFPETEGTT
jgi:glycerol-3-phosphate dehydrogenase